MGSASNGAFVIFCICHCHNVLHRHERWWWLQYALRCSHLIHKCKKMLILVLCRTLFFLVTASLTFIYVCILFSKHGVLIEWYILYIMSVFTVLSQYISFLLRMSLDDSIFLPHQGSTHLGLEQKGWWWVEEHHEELVDSGTIQAQCLL
jgi:hypothetical protein